MRSLPSGLQERARHARRMAGAAAREGLRRAVSRGDDHALGVELAAELDQLKGLAMKVGQILSSMDGALPEGTQRGLARLQRGAEPLALEAIEGVVQDALGAPVGQLFDRFDPQPVAAASIGQVHRAALDGQELAVKVQYPGVREGFEADLAQLHRVASLASLATAVDGPALVEDLAARLLEECDYLAEAQNTARFAAWFAGDEALRLPRVVAGRSADRVLTTSWCEGLSLDAFVATASPAARSRAGLTLARFAWTSQWRHGHIHADPHPGNQLYADDAVVVLDFGCVRRLDPAWLARERRVVRCVVEGDRAGFGPALHDSGVVASPRFDLDEHWAMLRFLWAPATRARFAFSRGWTEGLRRFSGPTNPNLRRMTLPPEAMWTLRLHVGLASTLARLGAEGPFRDLLMEVL